MDKILGKTCCSRVIVCVLLVVFVSAQANAQSSSEILNGTWNATIDYLELCSRYFPNPPVPFAKSTLTIKVEDEKISGVIKDDKNSTPFTGIINKTGTPHFYLEFSFRTNTGSQQTDVFVILEGSINYPDKKSLGGRVSLSFLKKESRRYTCGPWTAKRD